MYFTAQKDKAPLVNSGGAFRVHKTGFSLHVFGICKELVLSGGPTRTIFGQFGFVFITEEKSHGVFVELHIMFGTDMNPVNFYVFFA